MPKVIGKHVKPFAVIESPSGGLEVVPSKWLNKSLNSVKYPVEVKGTALALLVKTLATPKANWTDEPVSFHQSYDLYSVATKAMKKLEENGEIFSNVDTDYSKPRSRKPNRRYVSESESANEDGIGSTKKTKGKKRKMDKPEKNENAVRQQVTNLLQQANFEKKMKCVSTSSSTGVKKVKSVLHKTGFSATPEVPTFSAKNGTGLNTMMPTSVVTLPNMASTSSGPTGSQIACTLAQSLAASVKLPPLQQNNDITASRPASATVLINEAPGTTGSPSMLPATKSISADSALIGSSGSAVDLSICNVDVQQKSGVENILTLNMDGNLDQHSFDVIANASGIDSNIACNLVQSGKEAHKLADQEKPTGEPSGRISKSPKVQKQGKAVRSKPKKSVEASLNNQLLQENSIQLEEVKGMLRRIMNKLFPEEAAIRQPSGLPKLPISNYEHLKQLEDYLSNAENFGIMVNYLFCKVKHTHTEQACAKAALNALFKPSLCCAISWKGTHGTKYAIYGTQCVELIQCVATKLWDSATDLCALNGAIKRFFIVSLQKKTSSSLAEHDESSEDSANSASSGTEVESEPDEDSD